MDKSTTTTGQFEPSDKSRAALERVQNHPLPDDSIRLVESYADIIGDRDRFLWKWAHHLFPKFTLSSVAPEYVETLQDSKLVGLLFVSILDDVAEKHGDWTTFEEATKIPFEHQPVDYDRDGVDREVLTFASEVWEVFAPTIQKGPRADEFADIVRFDLKQVLNAMEYSHVANQNLEFVTRSELQRYDAHNMMLYGFADIDLVHSPNFDLSELSTLRRILERAQRMVRIGNWVTTWEREIFEGDFTSGIIAYALEQGIVTTDELRASRDSADERDAQVIIETIRDHTVEDVFLRQWQDELSTARTFEDQLDSVDGVAYLDGIETVMEYHLASRGLK